MVRSPRTRSGRSITTPHAASARAPVPPPPPAPSIPARGCVAGAGIGRDLRHLAVGEGVAKGRHRGGRRRGIGIREALGRGRDAVEDGLDQVVRVRAMDRGDEAERYQFAAGPPSWQEAQAPWNRRRRGEGSRPRGAVGAGLPAPRRRGSPGRSPWRGCRHPAGAPARRPRRPSGRRRCRGAPSGRCAGRRRDRPRSRAGARATGRSGPAPPSRRRSPRRGGPRPVVRPRARCAGCGRRRNGRAPHQIGAAVPVRAAGGSAKAGGRWNRAFQPAISGRRLNGARKLVSGIGFATGACAIR